MKRVLITGISGQDGAYLAKLLLENRCEVFGTSRDHEQNDFSKLHALGIFHRVKLMTMNSLDRNLVRSVIEAVEPSVIYNMACLSSVGRSFAFPEEAHDSIVRGTRTLLDAIVELDPNIRFFNPASSEMFGDTSAPATETAALNPKSPYAKAKVEAMQLTTDFRQDRGLYACSAIVFNHDSPLRPPNYVTRKIVDGAIAIAAGKRNELSLGNLRGIRDWGWAPEYVEAMSRMMTLDQADDFVIATGESYSLEQFVATTFDYVGLDWKEHITIDETLFRAADINQSLGYPEKAAKILGWRAEVTMPLVVRKMVDFVRSASQSEQD
jgi:GDPmannose 4,6-dehydratase